MTTINSVPCGNPDTGKPHVRFDEGDVASAKPRRWSPLYIKLLVAVTVFPMMATASFTFVGEDGGTARIVVPEKAYPSSVLAAEEITNYVGKITGRTMVIVKSDESRSGDVVIGTLDTLKAMPAAAKQAVEAAKKYEAVWTGMADGRFWIVGKEEVSEPYAAWHFLEAKLGVRWFQPAVPEDPGDYYEKAEKIVLEDYTEFREPDFVMRYLGQQGASVSDHIPYAGLDVAFRNGYTIGCPRAYWYWGAEDVKGAEYKRYYEPRSSKRLRGAGGHHMLGNSMNINEMYEKHPEWFALQDGRRVKGQQFCTSNPELIRHVIGFYIKWFEKQGGVGCFGFGLADRGTGWCECGKCCALDGPGEGPKGVDGKPVCISSRMCALVNTIGKALHERFPKLTIAFEPYAVFRDYPTNGEYPKYLRIQCSPHGRCYGHAFHDPGCPVNSKIYRQLVTDWQEKLGSPMWPYEYFTDTPPMYVCREVNEVEDIRNYRKIGFMGWYNEGFHYGSAWIASLDRLEYREMFPCNWQWLWTTGHLLWNADLDVNELLEDAESKYYGPAYPAMKKYHAYRRQLWKGRNECLGYPNKDARRPNLLNEPGSKEKLLAWLDEAEKLAADDKVRLHRISKDRFWLTEFWIKPNEKARELAGRSMNIPLLDRAVKMDGCGSDPAWKDALAVDGLLKREQETRSDRRFPVPEAIRTEVKVLADKANVYYFVKARQDDMTGLHESASKLDDAAWADDGVELALYPPAVENHYIHVAVSTTGAIYDARNPGGDTAFNTGSETKVVKGAHGWTMEIRVPWEKIYPIVKGEKWRMQFCIGRKADSIDEKIRGTYTFGGYLIHDTAEYLTFEFGAK